MGEFDYIAWLRRNTADSRSVIVGPGDDCAVLAASGPEPWLVTTDMLLEGSHFVLAEAGARRVGHKAMAVNLSDVAAMGGTPVAAFVSLGLPRRPDAEILAEELYRGMRDIADRFGTAIAGGDTNSWPGSLVINVTLLGRAGPQGPVLRRGAKPGDWLMVTGDLGGSIQGKHLDFTPRIAEALELQRHANIHAMIDISDGLSADAFHICEESRCGLVLFAEGVPISAAALNMADGRSPLEHALSDGEDFELAFAVGPEEGEQLLKSQPIKPTPLSHVGVFVEESSLFLEEAGMRRPIEPRGYVHRLR
ncbi:MAG: thiamine-monophosphate kinase [Planctomycetes bacterium]|nr:thiamine-monophosphate kinase [Planctomycetota bacterium]